MKVLIENLQTRMEVDDQLEGLLKQAAELCLAEESFDAATEIGVLLVDNERIREMNREHRNINKATDVLSFPMVDMVEGKMISNVGDYDLDENLLLLGDIVISLEKALEQAEEYGHSVRRELAFLATHGMFHLLGYDHENAEDRGKMFEKQERVLLKMGLPRESK